MPASLQAAFKKLIRFLHVQKVGYFLIGGIARNVWAEPRMTGDLDLTLILDVPQAEKLLPLFKKSGFAFHTETTERRLWNLGTAQASYQGIRIDLIVGNSEFDREAYGRRKQVTLFGTRCFVASAEDFILYKLLALRRQDLADVEAVYGNLGPRLDKKLIDRWAERFTRELLRPSILKEWRQIAH